MRTAGGAVGVCRRPRVIPRPESDAECDRWAHGSPSGVFFQARLDLMKRFLPLLLVAGLAVAGCGEGDESATESAAEPKTTTASEPKKSDDLSSQGERSLKRALDAALFPPYDGEIRGIKVSSPRWANVAISGSERDEQSKEMAAMVCGVLISWFVSTDEKYAQYGYVELTDGTRIAECEFGNVDIK